VSGFFPAPLAVVLFSFSSFARFAAPGSFVLPFSGFLPYSSELTCGGVWLAISSGVAFLKNKKTGALTATTFKPPLSLLTTSVASEKNSTSSEIIINGLPACTTASNNGTIGRRFVNFFSKRKKSGFSNSVVLLSFREKK
jgi:hypothetical protein